MHKIVMDEMERHLAGRASAAFYDHLAQCDPCRRETEAIQDTAELLRSFRVNEEEALAPPPAFYSRVVISINQEQRSAGWGLFAPQAVFFRRVAFASLLLLAGLGTYLITNEPEFSVNDATAIIAQQSSPANADSPGSANHRDQILLTLASWSE